MVLAGLAFFLALAVSIDFPRTALGFKGDEATYYSLTYSLARDGDMAFKREDLVRVWEEFSAPEGIFLKRGSQLHVERRSGFPYFGVVRTPDPAPDRLYFGKSYIYPLFAAPFVRIFGTSGFLVFHSLLLALCTAAGYSFLVARGSRPTAAAAFAAVFIFGVDRTGLLLLADAGVLQPHAGVPGRVRVGLQARRSSACSRVDACSGS